MAHLWIESLVDEWLVFPLSSPRVDLGCLPLSTSRRPIGAEGKEVTGAVLLQSDALGPSSWFLIVPPAQSLTINGLPLVGGLQLMDDRDEIRLPDGSSLFFSTEELPRVCPMPATDKPMNCARCRQRIEPESPAIRCPQCGIWHHQQEDLECWTYSSTCALCPQPTPFDIGFRWTPAEL